MSKPNSQVSGSAKMALAALLCVFAASASRAEEADKYAVECSAQACTVSSEELSFELMQVGGQWAMRPLSFTSSPNGMFVTSGASEPDEFRFVPDYIGPGEGHYSVKGGPGISEFVAGRDPATKDIDFEAFLEKIAAAEFVYVSISAIEGFGMLGVDERKLEAAPLLAAIAEARARLAGG